MVGKVDMCLPTYPNQSSNLLRRIVWSVVSKAAERSSRVNAVTLPSSTDDRISLWILRRSLSVQMKFPVYRLIMIDVCELLICEFRRLPITFSRSSERKQRLGTGR